MTKAEIVGRVRESTGLKLKQARIVVDAVLDGIKSGIADDGFMVIRGFGRWKTQVKLERGGRNPRTGEAYAISARRVVKFKASHKLAEVVN